MITGNAHAVEYFQDYANLLETHFVSIVNAGALFMNESNPPRATSPSKLVKAIAKKPLDRNAEDFILTFLLSEAQGGIRTAVKLVDLTLSLTNLSLGFNEKFRFRLGVGLAKLGLHDLSVKQVSLAAYQSDSPLYRLRAKLVFPPVHTSIGALAAAVNNFERQMESILLREVPQTDSMTQVCNSLSEAALALQALPLLHLIGFSAPRVAHGLGHLPVPLPILLGEVCLHMCPLVIDASYDADPEFYRTYMRQQPPALTKHSLLSWDIAASSSFATEGKGTGSSASEATSDVKRSARDSSSSLPSSSTKSTKSSSTASSSSAAAVAPVFLQDTKHAKRKLHIGIVAGSFDSLPGRIMIGLLDTFPDKLRKVVEFTAMCFPTPRSAVTDRVNSLFDHHINLSADNKTQVLQRVHHAHVDFILFADAAMDARVFALAQERLALYQGMLWSWGGTLGIRNVDFYFIPELFLQHSRCRASYTHPEGVGSMSYRRANQVPKILPQQHFTEQVVWLEGMPEMMPRTPSLRMEEAMGLFMQRYLLDLSNRTHIYLFPGSVKHWHPEFDRAIEVLFRTDPLAIVVLAVVKSGRDTLPTTHLAVSHDLLHPAMPLAGVHKLQQRIRSHILNQHMPSSSSSSTTAGTTGPSPHQGDRLRALPPLDEALYRALLRHSVAVLDPFPVGVHIAVLEAMLDGVPVISAPNLQECTNSHAFSLAKYMHIMPSHPAAASSSSIGTGSSSIPTTGGGGGDGNGGQMWHAKDFFPATAEEYGVLAVRVAKDAAFRRQFIVHQKTIVYHPEIYHTITTDHAAHHHHLLPMALQAQQYFALPGSSSSSGSSSNNNENYHPPQQDRPPPPGHFNNPTSVKVPHRPTHLEQIVSFVQQLLLGDLTE